MIDVLLATYRPDPSHLKAQVDSIRAQKDVEVNLLVREDAAGAGPCANFAALLAESRADYAAFADQDDVWRADKLAKLMARMRALEARYGRETPLLVFCDAEVVDADLSPLAPSLYRRSRLDPTRLRPHQLILQNVPNGNTMLFNAALREKARPIPPEAFMHDHWLMLVASVFGRTAFVDEPLLLYRQHGGNVLGGAAVGPRYFLRCVATGRARLRERLDANIRQAVAFADRYGAAAPAAFHALRGFAARPWPARVATLLRHRILKHGLPRTLGLLAVA